MKLTLLALALFSIAVWLLSSSMQSSRDDTDPPDGRSGMRLYTDSLTGCQYLATPYGSLTPRLNASGNQMGCK